MDKILIIRNVSRAFSNFKLDSLNIALSGGNILGIIGSNGAGKTTLIRLILNIIEADTGDIMILRKSNKDVTVKQDIGIAFDNSFFLPTWSANDIEKAISGFYKNWDSCRYNEILGKFKINRTLKVAKMSRGTQLKLMVAFAISHNARLLILDEPTSGLDLPARYELLNILKEYVSDGKNSVIFSSHIVSDIKEIADHIIVLQNGNVLYSNSLSCLLDKYIVVKGRKNDLHLIDRYVKNIDFANGTFKALADSKDSALISMNKFEIEVDSLENIVFLLEKDNMSLNTI